jgi:hypothetical protein
MKPKPRSRVNRKKAKTVLRLPDLECAKTAVLNSLTSADAKRGYRHAIDEFVDWYCSEPPSSIQSDRGFADLTMQLVLICTCLDVAVKQQFIGMAC